MDYEIGRFRGHRLWMCGDDIPDDNMDEDMYVNSYDYSVWYKGRQIGYMKSDKSRIEPFYEKAYNNLKFYTLPIKEKEKVKETTPAAESTPTSSLLDAGSEVEAMLESVKDYCGVAVLGDEVFADLARKLEALISVS